MLFKVKSLKWLKNQLESYDFTVVELVRGTLIKYKYDKDQTA